MYMVRASPEEEGASLGVGTRDHLSSDIQVGKVC